MEKSSVVYVRMRRRIVVPPDSVITLGQVARLVTESGHEQQLRRMPLHRVRPEDGSMLVIDMLQVVKAVREALPGMTVETFGEPHVLIEVAPASEGKPRLILLSLAWLMLFFGSGMALMNFHADVNMPAVQRRITELIVGRQERHPWLFQIPYSLGVGLGMLLFFNRLLRKRRSDEPNPLEVEMFMYQENVNHYIITEEYRKKHDEEEARDRGG
ncbi:stage V sporulation protein AA [Cohnella sp. CFH 77786]|uniref:stage V sporulation protein AA n=1 Tax=Cohnella sp. CFH 77786 TaxID=2662265 RepID=UPI001C60FD00|nr:stage V sporulation protein AA [Cohnella sp. CFH 77786]MBW5446702.1 stage V sporulation protein AA [Cohnella sp. CFH 77786]